MLALFATLSFGGVLFLLFIIALAFYLTVNRRRQTAWAMINQSFQGTPTSRRSPLTSLSTITAGMPVLVGAMSGVSLDTAADLPAGTPTILFGGSFALTVVAKSSLSPSVSAAINPGDAIYADGGTLDVTSNITTGFTLDKNSSGALFGYLDPTGPGILSGQTNTAAVVVLARGM